MKYAVLILLLFCSIMSNGQDWETLVYNPDQDSLELNPLKGLTPLYNVNNDFPHSIRGKILGLDAVMLGIDNFNWDIFDDFIAEVGAEGRFSYLQVNVDMGFNNSDLPAFLSNVERYYYDGADPDDDSNVPSVVVNYNNEEMMLAMLNFIERFGEKYNNDSRVFLVHYGLYGIFGEWGLGFGKKFVPEGEVWAMTPANQLRITNAFETAFDNKNLLARFPQNVPESQAVGYSDGLYFGASTSDESANFWFFHNLLKTYNADENWKKYPIGGEVDPDVQATVWENFPNDVIGLPGVSQNTDDAFNLTRPTFLFQDYMFNDITKVTNPVMWDNALKATKKTGYTFHIDNVKLTALDGKPAIEVNIKNTGLAPMYANWKVEIGYIDGAGVVQTLGTDSNWILSTIQPDVDDNYRSILSDVSIADGSHKIVLRIINPLESISNQAKPVRFANVTQDADVAGWITLGELTLSEGVAGIPPVKVAGISITPTTATIGLNDQIQLNADVLPFNASNKSVTWSSNRPKTAAIDENGLVTSKGLSGDIIITAYAQDGGMIGTTMITVLPYWKIPGIIEGEAYSDIFGAQINTAESSDQFGQLIGIQEGEKVIGNINDDTWIEYDVQVDQERVFELDINAASPFGVGKLNIITEAGDTLIKVDLTPGTEGSYNTYTTYSSSSFNLPVGSYTLILDVETSAFNLNWLEFKSVGCVNTVGTTCDDGDSTTENDVYTSECDCAGTLIPPATSTYTDIPSLIEAENYTEVFNAQKNVAPDGEVGDTILGFIGDDTYMTYSVSVGEEEAFIVELRAASPYGVGVVNVLNAVGDTLTTVALAPATADYDTYGIFTSDPFILPAGDQILTLDVVASAFNLNWIEFKTEPDAPTKSVAKVMQGIAGGDVYIEDIGYGVIMKSEDGLCWRYAPDENGVLVGTRVTCPY